MRIRTRLSLAFFLISVVPIGLVTAYSYYSSAAALRRADEGQADQMAAEMGGRMAWVMTDLGDRVERLWRMRVDSASAVYDCPAHGAAGPGHRGLDARPDASPQPLCHHRARRRRHRRHRWPHCRCVSRASALVPASSLARMARAYGTAYRDVLSLVERDPALAAPLGARVACFDRALSSRDSLNTKMAVGVSFS